MKKHFIKTLILLIISTLAFSQELKTVEAFTAGMEKKEGFLNFYWEKKGRRFVWDDPKYDNWDEGTGVTIRHPGNDPQPFLAPAFRIIQDRLNAIAAEAREMADSQS